MNVASSHEQQTETNAWIPFFKQWKIGTSVTAMTFGLSCAVITQITPIYKASVQLLLPLKLAEEPDSRKNAAPQQADVLVAKSFADMIHDDGIARKVIAELDLSHNPDFQPQANWFNDALAWVNHLLAQDSSGAALFAPSEIENDRVLREYEDRLKTLAESKALTILLSFQSRDPHLAQKIAVAHARAFVQSEIDYRRQDARAKVLWMKAELDHAAAEARDAQVAIQLNPTALVASKDTSAAAVSALKMRQLQATASQAIYDSVLKRYQDMLADQAYAGSDIRIWSDATVPTRPYFPRRLLFAAAAGMLSLIVGACAAALASVVRRKLGVEAISEMLDLPILGRLNAPCAGWGGYGQRARNRRHLFWQRVQEIRGTIDVTEKRHPIVLVTSVMPKEGKSLVASALARALAGSGQRTLLIDVNSRNPRYRLSLDRRTRSPGGLQQYIDGSVSAEQAAVQVDSTSPLFLMANKGAGATDLSSMTSTALKSRLVALKKSFDVILIDAPALESLSDALQLAAFSDDVLLVLHPDGDALATMREKVAKLRARSPKTRGMVVVDRASPSAEELERIEGYALDETFRDVWPKARPRPFFGKDMLVRLFGKDPTAEKPAEASI